jgi:AcrR family transcriptional regulator
MPRRYTMGKRAVEAETTRHQIFDAVIDVIAEAGIDALTVQAVAARADVAVRTVYNHFESREGLLAAALGTLATQTRDAVEAIVVPDRPARIQLLEFIDAYARSYEDQGTGVQVLMAATSIPQVADAVDGVRTWRRQRLRRILREADAQGSLRVPLPEATTIAYLATAYSTYATLVLDAGLSPASARSTLRAIVEGTLLERT